MSKKKRVNPHQQPRTEADCKRARTEGCIDGLRLMEAVILRVLIDKHSEVDVEAVWNEMGVYCEQYAAGKLTTAQIRDTLKNEDGIELMGGPSKAFIRTRGMDRDEG